MMHPSRSTFSSGLFGALCSGAVLRGRFAAGAVGLLALMSFVPAADGELVILTNRDYFKVTEFAARGDRMHLELASGGKLVLPMSLVERVVDDEIVDKPEPLAPPEPVSLAFDENLPRPQTPYGELIWEASRRHDVSPVLVAAMVRHESSFRPQAVSTAGARGLMQLMPATAHRFGVGEHELFDPRRNLEAGTAYLRFLVDRFDGHLLHVLAAYNAGEGAVDRYGGVPPYRETRTYVRRILGTLGLGEDGRPAVVENAA